MKQRKVLNTITSCGSDFLMPFALVYIFYVILHGHLSPGGGFQGGVLIAAVVVLLYLGHGYEVTTKALSLNLMHKSEGVISAAYIVVAMLGVVAGAQFCQNVLFEQGNIGDLYSSGTIFWMDTIVGLKVFTGVAALILSMLGLLALNKDKE